jgi:NAD(P)H dehydrogenase (quinone)
MALPELAITGATGALGGRVARRIAEREVAQRLVVRDLATAPLVAGATRPIYDSAIGRILPDALGGAGT